RLRKAFNEASTNRVADLHKYDGYAARCLQCPHCCATNGHNDIWCKGKQLSSVAAIAVGITGAPAIVDAQVALDGPAQFVQPLLENLDTGLPFRIVRSKGHKHADMTHPLGLLRSRRQRPRHCRAAE